MRLICPRCDAHYEIDDDAIPVGGRDVQCSNCGHGWYADRTFPPAARATGAQVPPVAVTRPVPGGVPVPGGIAAAFASSAGAAAAAVPPAPTDGADAGSGDAPHETADRSDADGPPDSAGLPQAESRLDEALRRMLREEAEREAQARLAEASRALESQPDLGLMPAGTAPVAAVTAGAAAPAAAARRPAFPDVEEINSTLRAGRDPRDELVETEPDPAPRRLRPFRSGFVAALALVLLLIGIYLAAPILTRQVPMVAGVLQVYVQAVNGTRAAVDTLIEQAAGAIRSLGAADAGG